MKNKPKPGILSRANGFAALPLIALLAVMLTASLVFIMRRGISNQDAAAHVQLRTDYRQREDALVRALLAIVPNKAIGCMQAGSASTPSLYSWDTIFSEAVTYAKGGEQLSTAAKGALGLASAMNSNTGDSNGDTSDLILPMVAGAGTVVAGNLQSSDLFAGQSFVAKLPPMLGGSGSVLAKDQLYPIVSKSKLLTQNDPTLEYELSAASYPLYNRVRFPQVRFSFANPGDYVVGKRNWWAFSVEYGNGTGLGTVKKNYVLSLYELPNQLPISATAATTVGAYSDGVAWDQNIWVRGSIFADRLTTAGSFNFDRLIGRESLVLAGDDYVGDTAMAGDFDALGTRERMAAEKGTQFLPLAVASNAGKIAFMSLKRGSEFYTEAAAPATNTLSNTTWDDYTRGPNQCAIKVYVKKMVALENQTPTQLEIHYKNADGSQGVKTLTRSSAPLAAGDPVPADYWPYNNALWAGGSDVPFQTELGTDIKHPLISVYPAKLTAWLTTLGAAPTSTNNSIYITPLVAADPTTIVTPSNPSVDGDLAVVMRESEDLSSFPNGFSIVTNLRFYLADDANQVAITPPTNAGLPVGEAFYPPFSVFAPEYRVGTTAGARPLDVKGQIASLENTSTGVFNPLDFKAGGDNNLHSDKITADLRQIVSPAELPPVVSMNWLLTVEEIH